MGIWTHSLKFNGGIHQLPQMTGNGFHSLLQEVVWDVGDNVPNPVLQLFHCARFCLVHLPLCPAPQEKVTGREIWTSCRLFMRSLSSQPTSQKLLIQPGTYTQCKVWWCVIVHENKFIDVFPARYDRPHVIFQHLKTAFSIHGVTQKIWADDPSGHHSTPHGHFWTILHLLHRHFGIVCRKLPIWKTASLLQRMFSKSFGQSSCQPSINSPYSILRSQSSGVSSCMYWGFRGRKFKSFFNTVRTVCLDSPLSRAA